MGSPTDHQYTPTIEQAKPPADTGESLAFTGFDFGVMAFVAVLALTAGGVLRWMGRREEQNR